MAGPSLPLEGIRAIDFTEVWAGPMGTSYLGDLGAQVIKVESYPRAPYTRPTVAPKGLFGYVGEGPNDSRPWDRSGTHNLPNRNKYGIALNARPQEGRKLFMQLVALSDVLVEGYAAGTAQRMGLDYSALREVNPELIMISMPGWGASGPYQGYVTLGSGIDASSGHHYLRGYPDADPTQTVACVHSDAVAAVTLVFATVSALFYRRRTGKGQWIDLSQEEAFLPHLAHPLLDYALNGRVAQPLGNHDRLMTPHSCYPCRGEDAWAVICVETEAQWRALCRAAGRPEWEHDPRFADIDERRRHQDELDQLIAAWTREQGRQELVRLLQEAGVPAGPVMDELEMLSDPHLLARGFFQEATHSVVGTHRYPGPPWKFTDTPLDINLAPCALGEHNRQVFQGLLGISEGDYSGLEERGLIGDTYGPTANA